MALFHLDDEPAVPLAEKDLKGSGPSLGIARVRTESGRRGGSVKPEISGNRHLRQRYGQATFANVVTGNDEAVADGCMKSAIPRWC